MKRRVKLTIKDALLLRNAADAMQPELGRWEKEDGVSSYVVPCYFEKQGDAFHAPMLMRLIADSIGAGDITSMSIYPDTFEGRREWARDVKAAQSKL